MIDPFRPILPPRPIDIPQVSPAGKGGAGSNAAGFSELFEQSIARVNEFQQASKEKTEALMRGEDLDVHEVVLAGQRAELAFDYFLQVRSKVVQAYQEIMRMQM